MNYSKYKSSYLDSFIDLSIHSLLYLSSLYGTWYYRNHCLSILIISLLGLMNMRTFIIYHDCGHNSYTPNKKINYILGSILGIFVFTPFCWTYSHHNHHLTAGNINNKLEHNHNETVLYTLKEYNEMGNMKYIYKIIKNPFMFFIIIPFLKFLILNRFEILLYKYNNDSYKQDIYRILFDTLFNNIGKFLLLIYMYQFGILYQYLSSIVIASSLGVMLFHNQHTFNPAYVVTNDKWNKKDSGLIGSSFIQIPNYLKYFTMGIEYHHIHHMNASIPGYNLKKYHENNNFDKLNITKLSMNDCYHNLWLTLYDEDNNKYITL